jgi:cell division protein FtsI (penicillin-binding protein 3)
MTGQRVKNPVRRLLVMGMMMAGMGMLIWRAVDLQVLRKDFLQGQGDARYLRVVNVPAHRGMITDRHGEPLAISTPVDSVWANPQEFSASPSQYKQLTQLLGLNKSDIQQLLAKNQQREFIYLKRQVNPDLGQRVMALDIPGVALQREYHRYYPTGEVTGHVIGFTNVDDEGQEGLELAYDDWLRGVNGAKRVIKDRLGRIVENVESIKQPRPGHQLALSIDRRIQYLAYRELKAAVKRHKAKSGSAVLLDIQTGEVLAMVNQPAFNPNNRDELLGRLYRNRAVTDVFEPGSSIKPFTITAALESGLYQPNTPIDTTPGLFRVGHNTIRDVRNYGRIDVSTVIQKSSNVGASKIALTLKPERIWDMLSRAGFGIQTGAGFPGEANGWLPDFSRWRRFEQATLSFGYGLSVTPLQLVRAYAAIAGDGILRPVSFVRVNNQQDVDDLSKRIVSPEIVAQVRSMLEKAVSKHGTGSRAQVAGYKVAGKTGTVKKSGVGGYLEDHYISVFAGVAPASRPRLAMVVVVKEPSKGGYYGGLVAAPVFSAVMGGALRLLNIAPDDLPSEPTRVAHLEGAL